MFQSHAGSIEARRPSPLSRGSSIGFNPTLVRLRPVEQLCENFGIELGFNPTLVRLRQADDEAMQMIFPVFQSHAGSIEAPAGRGRTGHRRCRVSIPRWFD